MWRHGCPSGGFGIDRSVRFADHPAGPIPVISVLYQAHDATAALLAATLDSRATSVPRRPAVTRTVRTALADTEVGRTRIPAGAQVVLDALPPPV